MGYRICSRYRGHLYRRGGRRRARHPCHRQGPDHAATHLRRHARRHRSGGGGVQHPGRRSAAAVRHADLRDHASHQRGGHAVDGENRISDDSRLPRYPRAQGGRQVRSARLQLRLPAALHPAPIHLRDRRAHRLAGQCRASARSSAGPHGGARTQAAQIRGDRRQPDVVDRQRRPRAGDRAYPRRRDARGSLHALARVDPDRARISPRLHHGGRCFPQAADAGASAADGGGSARARFHRRAPDRHLGRGLPARGRGRGPAGADAQVGSRHGAGCRAGLHHDRKARRRRDRV